MIKDMGKGLTPIAKASDGVVEAFQNKNHPFFYGVQWHPEMMSTRGNKDMKKIFDRFIGACNTKEFLVINGKKDRKIERIEFRNKNK